MASESVYKKSLKRCQGRRRVQRSKVLKMQNNRIRIKKKKRAKVDNKMLKIQNKSRDESDCMLIEPNFEIIVIDDEDEGNSEEIKEVEFNENPSKCKVADNGNKLLEDFQRFENKSINQTVPNISQSESLFFEDLHPKSKEVEVPTYNRISNGLSLINGVKLSPTGQAPALPHAGTRIDLSLISVDDGDSMLGELAVATNEIEKEETMDDSVIFVGEEIDLDSFDVNYHNSQFIPISNNRSKGKLSNKAIKHSRNNNLLSIEESKAMELYNTNAYNPNKEVCNTGKRMVIIDGSNVAFGHSLDKEFSVKGLEICLEFFEKIGHEVKAVVPQFRRQKGKSSDPAVLEKLHSKGKIVFTPCKNLPGKSTASYDDRFILQLASTFDAAVISNDNYRDLIDENPAFKKIIESRVIGYTWCKDVFILPKDPYGRLGPSLNIILNHS